MSFAVGCMLSVLFIFDILDMLDMLDMFGIVVRERDWVLRKMLNMDKKIAQYI